MTTLKNTLRDSNNGLDYTMVNGYYLPNLTVAAPTDAGWCGWVTQEKAKRDLISLKIEFYDR